MYNLSTTLYNLSTSVQIVHRATTDRQVVADDEVPRAIDVAVPGDGDDNNDEVPQTKDSTVPNPLLADLLMNAL